MRHTVLLHGVIVGHSDLVNADAGSGRAWGQFRPGLGYELVQPIFRLFAQAVPRDGTDRDQAKLERYYAARDALKLVLEIEDRVPVSTSSIHIADYSVEEGPSAIELDVLIRDDGYWERRASSS